MSVSEQAPAAERFSPGSIVRARGREWIVQPESAGDLLVLHPLGGSAIEAAGVLATLEKVESAQFDPPDPSQLGDYLSCRLLRDSLRIGFRSSAGPFRSVAKVAVEPRPYQLVPLLMALRLDPVRLLIADDVGVGKTIEAALIAKELLEQGDATGLCVLCPPHLAEQWRGELSEKFHIEAEVVLPSTVSRLERQTSFGQSLFEAHPVTIVSIDFIKSDRRRDDFVRACPNLVIVDEAHTCSVGAETHNRHLRNQLVTKLAEDDDRHIVLVTATPHSGKPESFKSLVALLNSKLREMPDDLNGPQNEKHRRALARHMVQRRRGDIRHYLETDTSFPDREDSEAAYELTPEYQKLFNRAVDYAREKIRDTETGTYRNRVQWWSALALLRSLGSSPMAAAETLRTRAAAINTETPEEADEVGRRTVLDLADDDAGDPSDVIPGSISDEIESETSPAVAESEQRRLREMAKAAEALAGDGDPKLKKATKLIAELLKDGFSPIVFCRFIPTAEYLAEQLRKKLKKGTEVIAVTGRLPHDEREARVCELAKSEKRILVATDCLSEGINLQDWFDAVVHYDLAWNPTRHEQRDGRVDRFGQKSPKVRVLTYYSTDNQIDGIVLDILIRKHKAIRQATGVSVPVPVDSNNLVEAIFEGLLLREQSGSQGEQLRLLDEFLKPKREELFGEWEQAADTEKRSRTIFAQHGIDAAEVGEVVDEMRRAMGSPGSVRDFILTAIPALGGTAKTATAKPLDTVEINLAHTPRALRDYASTNTAPGPTHNGSNDLTATFDFPAPKGAQYFSRTHPFVNGLATYLLDLAIDPVDEPGAGQISPARRCGAFRTSGVTTATTLVLLRIRFHLTAKTPSGLKRSLVEDCGVLAWRNSTGKAEWLEPDEIEALLDTRPDGNIASEDARTRIAAALESAAGLAPVFEAEALRRADAVAEQHMRVREAAKAKGAKVDVEAELPRDIVGIYVYVPQPQAQATQGGGA
ncbi:MAG: ATP-dependent helicase [Acidobacteria bacterium]|nr:MAG: ATP-dependent helicase [Acidobacteriota bacterium]